MTHHHAFTFHSSALCVTHLEEHSLHYLLIFNIACCTYYTFISMQFLFCMTKTLYIRYHDKSVNKHYIMIPYKTNHSASTIQHPDSCTLIALDIILIALILIQLQLQIFTRSHWWQKSIWKYSTCPGSLTFSARDVWDYKTRCGVDAVQPCSGYGCRNSLIIVIKIVLVH